MEITHKTAAHLLDGLVKLNANHQTAPSDVGDVRTAGLKFTERLQQEVSDAGSIGSQLFSLHHVQHGECGGAAEVIASESRAEHAVGGFKLRRDEDGTHREAVGDSFGTGDEVGRDAKVLVGEEASRATVAALNLVADEHGAGFVAEFPKSLHEFRSGEADAADALDALHDDGSDVALAKFGFKGGKVVQREEGDVTVGVDGCHDFGVVGGFNRQRGASVECFRGSEHTTSSRVERCQFQRVLIGFCTGVDEEEREIGIACCLGKTSP